LTTQPGFPAFLDTEFPKDIAEAVIRETFEFAGTHLSDVAKQMCGKSIRWIHPFRTHLDTDPG
jgi:hypothetical protein